MLTWENGTSLLRESWHEKILHKRMLTLENITWMLTWENITWLC